MENLETYDGSLKLDIELRAKRHLKEKIHAELAELKDLKVGANNFVFEIIVHLLILGENGKHQKARLIFDNTLDLELVPNGLVSPKVASCWAGPINLVEQLVTKNASLYLDIDCDNGKPRAFVVEFALGTFWTQSEISWRKMKRLGFTI